MARDNHATAAATTGGTGPQPACDVILASRSNVQHAAALIRSTQREWLYLGHHMQTLRRLEALLGPALPEIPSTTLNELAHDVRDEYLGIVASLASKRSSDSWWLSRVAEKQVTHSSELFRGLCLIERYRRSRETGASLVVIVEEPALFDVLKAAWPRDTHRDVPLRRASAFVRDAVSLVIRRPYFVADHLSRIFHTRRHRAYTREALASLAGSSVSLIASWVDDRSFTPDGMRDSYLGDLAQATPPDGRRIAIMPLLLTTTPYSAAVDRVADLASHPCLIPHAFITAGDVLRASVSNLSRVVPRGAIDFRGVDVEPLARADGRRDRIDHRFCFANLMERLPSRLARAGVSPSSITYPFENQSWEKGLLLGVRDAFPDARCVGYQHSTITDLKMNYFMHRSEAALAPLPDVIATSGPLPTHLLAVPYGEAVTEVGTLRYAHAFEETAGAGSEPDDRRPLLLATSNDPDEAAELLLATAYALESASASVVIRVHPGLDAGALLAHAGLTEAPPGFALSSAGDQSGPEDSRALVYTSTTMALEALLSGVPAIAVGLKRSIVMDPVAAAPAGRRIVATTVEFRERLAELPDASSSPDLVRAEGRSVVEAHFSAPTAASYDVLLGGESHLAR